MEHAHKDRVEENKLNEKNMAMAPVAKSLLCGPTEVELLLRLTLDYKANKLQENVELSWHEATLNT